MNKVFLIQKDFFSGLEKAFKELDFKKRFSKKRTAVKMHFGERGNLNYVRPGLASKIIELLKEADAKPFLFDSVTKYRAERYTIKDHLKTARSNGFSKQTMGCPIIIGDSGKKIQGKLIEIEVCKEIANADAMLVLSHAKGHAFSGIGAAIKNLGMGCVSRSTKKAEHNAAQMLVNKEKCTGCRSCEPVCPVAAIKVKEEKAVVDYSACWGCGKCMKVCSHSALRPRLALPDHLLASAALEALNCFEKENILFVNVLTSISAECDCHGEKGAGIMRDIGLLVSDSITAIDAASIELINKDFGSDFSDALGYRSPFQQIEWLEAHGIEKREFKLVSL